VGGGGRGNFNGFEGSQAASARPSGRGIKEYNFRKLIYIIFENSIRNAEAIWDKSVNET
jgi:hypothetical protein